MAIEFKLPELGENITSADISKVLVKPGDKVKVDQVLFEIETDKATVEVPSEVDGIVKEVLVSEGDTAKVGQVMITFEESGIESEASSEPEETESVAEEVTETESPNETETVEEESAQIESGVFDFRLPELGENITSAEISKIVVSEGDEIEKDQILMELETDKATVEVPSEVSGKVLKINYKDGDSVKIGDVVLSITTSSEVPTKKVEPKKEVAKVSTPPEKEVRVESKIESESTHTMPSRTLSSGILPSKEEIAKRIVPAAPSTRRFAREIGVEISNVKGNGPGGRISHDDVKKYAKSINEKIEKGGAVGGFVSQEPLPDFSKWGEIEAEPMSKIRKTTANHLSYAWATVPHVTQFDKADITELEEVRKQFKGRVESVGGKLTITSILVKVIAAALKEFPQFNASVDMQNNQVILKKYYNVGIAADTPKGLLVPVIKDVDKKGITEISVEMTELSKKARDGKLSLAEMQGGNFSISNLGGIGGTYFTPIVNTPEVAILGVSRSALEPVYIDGEFKPRLMMPLSLSYDHRIIDGADAIRFLRWVIEALENPFLMSL
ncbi:MAG: dihydrolipoyllysine-residue acetyltransferase [Melioribacteraceae bacterium]|nr:dihydrolipoyllysine-residue acetyltransferase [Melioribacteraceae bacterium]MCF8265588.1 dihydrolipoyllysine-residue acetyltransferase [Melioribacteraceae bacterium]MCF8431525.1 dihydrolipoyllysine-residue acetyltransferase [Melioribacteraceae bacterium]